MKVFASVGWSILLALALACICRAQQGSPAQTDPTSAAAPVDPSNELKAIRSKRARSAHPAEFQRAGVVQMEYGYDGNFHSPALPADQAGSLTINFAILDQLLAEFDMDILAWQTDPSENLRRGIGDGHLGAQVTAFEDTKRHPSLGFAYYVKFPWASESKGLGTGRFDHKIIGLISRKVGATEIDLNAALLVNGHESQSGWGTGSQFALALSRELSHGFSVQGELSRQNLDTDQPRGAFALGSVNYLASSKLVFDAGMRFGLTSVAPDFGVFAGVTVAVADLYRKRR